MSLSITDLPREMHFEICKALFDSYGAEAISHPFAIRETCTELKKSTDRFLKKVWAEFEKEVPRRGSLQVDRSFLVVESAQGQKVSAIRLFAQLNKKIRILCERAAVEFPKGAFLVSCTQLNKLQDLAQAEQDEALTICWPEIKGRIHQRIFYPNPSDPPIPLEIASRVPDDNASLNSIRHYLGQWEITAIINFLDFRNRGIRTIPSEIFLFNCLTELDLRGNQIKRITVDVNLLERLSHLFLTNNPIESLPIGFNPPHLQMLRIPKTTKILEELSPRVRAAMVEF
jgi:hypothetical protein